jgi:hypothetical protein
MIYAKNHTYGMLKKPKYHMLVYTIITVWSYHNLKTKIVIWGNPLTKRSCFGENSIYLV